MLIDKIKHRDELEQVYKEYKGKSSWAQSRPSLSNRKLITDIKHKPSETLVKQI
ncbi:MAG: hypothetical protein K2J08_07985 [Ruminococcus sp.]|nr:hypothetical protein [Ruminococcus sp.]